MLQIRHLSKTYPGGVRALADVSLDIPRGMFGLLGPNGAGKSTLMRTIATLQEADEGTITLDGLDVLREKEEVRRRLGYLPQEFGVYSRITAEAMLDHFALLKGVTERGERRDLVERLLVRTNLWEIRKRRLDTFSGGMKQRFGIAQALIGDPELVIVDEPTAGLDPEERNRFHDLLAEIGENVVVLLSTHIVEDVRDLCARMAILSGGRVLRSGEPQGMIESLRGKVWRRVVARSEIEAWRARLPVLSTRLSGGRPVMHVYAEDRPDEGFEPAPPDLRDVYFAALRPAV
ncbi:MAG: ABC transporter ATP-binding protein [Candidatus Latescibacterota bacterium]|nr:MAG: ABC transporter ATP-binding protein [Candidatus Latescibacterota bacterium]